MEITELLTQPGVITMLRAANKRQALQELARRAATISGIDEAKIFESLWEREQLGTTGIGGGTAVPHGRIAGIKQPLAIFARLEKPIDFESIDGEPVNLVFMLLTAPDAGADHLKALAQISRVLRNRNICSKLRGADSADAIYAVLTDRTTSHAA